MTTIAANITSAEECNSNVKLLDNTIITATKIIISSTQDDELSDDDDDDDEIYIETAVEGGIIIRKKIEKAKWSQNEVSI